jgi:hypothetical protein
MTSTSCRTRRRRCSGACGLWRCAQQTAALPVWYFVLQCVAVSPRGYRILNDTLEVEKMSAGKYSLEMREMSIT